MLRSSLALTFATAALVLAGCGDDQFPEPQDGYTITLVTAPEELMPGVEFSVTVSVLHEGAAYTEGVPTCLWSLDGGTGAGEIVLQATGEPGFFSGTHTLEMEGDYMFEVEIDDDHHAERIVRMFTVHVGHQHADDGHGHAH